MNSRPMTKRALALASAALILCGIALAFTSQPASASTRTWHPRPDQVWLNPANPRCWRIVQYHGTRICIPLRTWHPLVLTRSSVLVKPTYSARSWTSAVISR